MLQDAFRSKVRVRAWTPRRPPDLLRNEGLGSAALEEPPTERIPPLFIKAFYGPKAHVRAWPLGCFPLGEPLQKPPRGGPSRQHWMSDVLLAQRIGPGESEPGSRVGSGAPPEDTGRVREHEESWGKQRF